MSTLPLRRLGHALLALALCLVALLAGCSRSAKKAASRPVAEAIREALAGADTLLAGHPWLADSAVRADLAALYPKRGLRAFWISDSGLTPSADALAAAVRRARSHGLDPAAYGVDDAYQAARAVVARQRRSHFPAESLAAAEVRLSAGYVAYARHLLWGRIPPASLDPDWRWGRDSLDLPAALAEAASDQRIGRLLESLAPRDTAYLLLQAALARLDREARGGPTVRRGGKLTGDTLGARRRVELNLERRRWMPRQLGEPRVEVNIPDFTFALVDSGAVKLAMRVVVGQKTHPTPVFSDAMTYLELNPTWRLPSRIIVEEVVPELKRDTTYLAKQGIRVLWKRSDPFQEHHYSVVNWSAAESDTFSYFLRQDPGPLNALGQIKFMLPNEFDVYLHDTPNRGAFRSDRRARSHGCVRLEKPLDLARRLTANVPGFSPDSLDSILVAGARRAVVLPARIPVHIGYWTAWVDPKGVLQQRDDLYGLDGRLERALREREVAAFAINPEVIWGARADSIAAARAGLKPRKRRGDVTP